MATLRPLPGYCIIRLDAAMNAIESGIVIPHTAQRARGFSGLCVSACAGREDTPIAGEAVGKRVLLETWAGRLVGWGGEDLFITKIKNILAILPEDAGKVKIESGTEYGVRRCRRCKSRDGEGNIILDGEGYCPVCGLNDAGDRPHTETVMDEDGMGRHKMRVSESAARVSDEDIARFGGPAPDMRKYPKKAMVTRP